MRSIGMSGYGRAFCAVVISVLLLGTSASANLVVNGDFETDAALFETWPGYTGWAPNPGEIPGWTGTGNRGINGPDIGAGTPFSDNGDNPTNALFMQGAGMLEQQITGLNIGEEYTLSLDFNARGWGVPLALPAAAILFDDVVVASMVDVFGGDGEVPPVMGDPPNPWYHADLPFTATAAEFKLGFASSVPQGGDATFLLDNVVLVPEPLSLSLLALGSLALILRRRV